MVTPPPNSQSRISTPEGNSAQVFIAEMPPIPEDVKRRFPSMSDYEVKLKEWVEKLNFNVNPP